MKWLFVTHDAWPLTNGTALRVRHLCLALMETGDRVELLTDSLSRGSENAYHDMGVKCHLVDATERRRCDRNSPFDRNSAIGHELSKVANQDSAVVLSGASALQYARDCDASNVIADIIDDAPTEIGRRLWQGRNPLQWMRRLKMLRELRRYEKQHVAHVSLACFVSEVDRDAFRRRHPSTVACTVANGVDLTYFTPARRLTSEENVLFVGNLDFLPNQLAAAELSRHIAPRVWQHKPEACFTLVGPKPPAWLTRAASRRFRVTGMVDDIRPYLEGASVVCLPMTIGTGIKNKFLEAWASALPVVASVLACQGLPIDDGVNACVADSRDAMARAICRLLDDPPLRQRMGNAGRATVERCLAWRHVAGTLRSEVLATCRRGAA